VITDLSPTLYTYSSLSTVYRKYNRREYRPVQTPTLNLLRTSNPLTLLQTVTDPLITFTDRYGDPLPSANYYGPLKTPYGHPYPSANHYGPIKTPYGNPLPFCEPLRTRQLPLRTTTRPLPPATSHYYPLLHYIV